MKMNQIVVVVNRMILAVERRDEIGRIGIRDYLDRYLGGIRSIRYWYQDLGGDVMVYHRLR